MCASTHLSEITRVVLVHVDAIVVLPTGVTAARRVLAVLADTPVPRGHVATLLAVLVQLTRGEGGRVGGVRARVSGLSSCCGSGAPKTSLRIAGISFF
jgi:hypothetical protein